MRRVRGILPAVFAIALNACSQMAPPGGAIATAGGSPQTQGGGVVEAREHLSGRFVALIGPKAQHAPPYLDTAGTNFYCLRSLIDRKTGETIDQLYVSDSYDGAERNWSDAHDGAGQSLRFIPISHHKIGCDGTCSYLEEFAADIPETELRDSPKGLAVTFVDRAGDQKTITLSANQISAQLTALDARRVAASSPGAPARP
ncbi:MAG TPA: hypothetical protein VGR45_11480 [Stellaceae bacterium]|nr:hypothetical protein [Stellaceae bacterium]